MIETTEYIRKPFTVQAAPRVTEQNMLDIALWCNGTCMAGAEDGSHGPYIQVDTINPINDKQSQAHIGDWVLKSSNGFKVYTNKAFVNTFDPVGTVEVPREITEVNPPTALPVDG